MVQLLDGKYEALQLTEQYKQHVLSFQRTYNITPTLAVILVGDNISSHIYVKRKRIKAMEIGVHAKLHHLSADTSQEQLEKLIADLNDDPLVHGILIQMPLPSHMDRDHILRCLSPLKDVDGLTPDNIGLLISGTPRFIPCTPLGCRHLVHIWKKDITGLHAVVVGRSLLVGTPVARLLLNDNATVTQAHSFSKDLPEICRTADILVVAIGRPNTIQKGWVKKGACVIDVGINSQGQAELTGDVDFENVSKVAGAISPVPGGVGPLTIMYLMENLIHAARMTVHA